jgi:2,4-dienoyl-CoA reductase-like NADH-dependent reductase (Old Yellow Enzyme family)
MKIKHHFCCAFRDELKETLDQLSIPYESFSMHPVREDSYLIFDIFEEEKVFCSVMQMIKDEDNHIQQVIYAEADLLAAEWLTLRCTNTSLELAREETIFNCFEPMERNGFRHREIAGNPFSAGKADLIDVGRALLKDAHWRETA